MQLVGLAYPQTPVALICSKTSPCPGAYTGASCSFNFWSAVTCNEGFGSDVLIVAGVELVVSYVDALEAGLPDAEGLTTDACAMI